MKELCKCACSCYSAFDQKHEAIIVGFKVPREYEVELGFGSTLEDMLDGLRIEKTVTDRTFRKMYYFALMEGAEEFEIAKISVSGPPHNVDSFIEVPFDNSRKFQVVNTYRRADGTIVYVIDYFETVDDPEKTLEDYLNDVIDKVKSKLKREANKALESAVYEKDKEIQMLRRQVEELKKAKTSKGFWKRG